ncbi:hypothetical protein [Glycomyces harbinensis]|uniref:Glycosyl hydrolases family 38 N-terminal domain-containing protein n=1 Tax=Glycomyces harbinensis TaxID=58114 RepID=A0A1G6WX07_9ACTN|nr:hypothetical protein [Glycomyces harbinensis]SDD70422.1 Glycosyl hydrolases family 38 N-terminal domain-containing protein [Glycomyces harbinensis]
MPEVIEFPIGGADLPAFQPGPLDAEAGWRDHRVELRTAVPSEGHGPEGHWLLRLEFDAGHGPCPDLLIDLDGERTGLFHPEVVREDRAEVYRHGPIAGSAILEVPLGPLAAGRHAIGLTTTLDTAAATGPVADPGGPTRHREQFGHHFGSGITWRRLALVSYDAAEANGVPTAPATEPGAPIGTATEVPTAPATRAASGAPSASAPGAPTAAHVDLRSTPLFIESEGLQQLIDLTVTVPIGTEPPRTAEVRIGDRTWTHGLTRPGRDFGQFRVRFPVPELAGPTETEVRLGSVDPNAAGSGGVDSGDAAGNRVANGGGGFEVAATDGTGADDAGFSDVAASPAANGATGGGTAATDRVRSFSREPVAFILEPKRKWTVHLIPHVHLDVGYTDVQGKVLELHSRNLDRALAALDRNADFAFSVDGSLIVAQYLATRSPERSERVLAALRSGRVSVNAFHSLFLSGVASLEEVYRAAYLAARLREDHGVPVDYANLTDVPSYSAAVPSMLRALGIDAFVGIENHHRGGNADSDLQHLASPVMWEGVDGSRVLAHFSDTYSQLRFMAGDPQTLPGGAHALDRFLARYERDDYLPHDLPVIGTHADNEDLADGDAAFAARWNAAYAWPRIAVSTMAGYLDAVRPLADRLPVWRGDGGSYWEDGVGTGATVAAEHRRTQTALPVAEALTALVARADDTYRPNRAALDAAWEGALFGCEHTWTWSHANAHPHGEQVGDQLDWKRHQVHTGHRNAVDETRRALSQLGELVTTDGPTVLAHNPLGWARDVEIEVEAPAGTPFLLNGAPLPTEALADCDGLVRHRLTVPDVPPFGYRTVPMGSARTLAPGEEGGQAERAAAAGDDWRPVPETLTTDRWELALAPDTGAVRSLTHRPTGRTLLDTSSAWHLGDVLYVLNGPDTLTRGDHPDAFTHSGAPHTHPHPPRSTLSGRRPIADPPELTVTAAAMRPVGLRRTYDGWRLRTVGTAPNLPHVEVDLLLRDGDDRVDVLVRLEKKRELAKEAVYVAFPFAAEDPRLAYDRQQGWIDPATDHAPGACHEWFTTQYGVTVSSGPGGPAVVWTSADAPLFTAGDIVRGAWPEQFHIPNGSIFSWVMNNYWPTNTPPEQDGTLELRYAFTPMPAFDAAAAGRFGREVRFPGVPGEVNRLDKFDTEPRPLPADAASLLDLDLPPEVHATVAEPRDRRGLLVRFQDLSGRGTRVPLPTTGTAVRCTADETPLEPLLDATVTLRPWEVVSILLHENGDAR